MPNKFDADCVNITPLDRYIRDHYLSFSEVRLSNLRGVLKSLEKEKSIDNLKEDLGENWEDTFYNISSKLAKKMPLSDEDEEFIENYATYLSLFVQDENYKDVIKSYVCDSSGNHVGINKIYKEFKDKIPAIYREEVLSQIASLFIMSVDALSKQLKYADYTREEIIKSKGVDTIFSVIRKRLKNNRDRLFQDNGWAEDYHDEQTDIIDALLDPDSNLWNSCIYLSKSLLLDAEKIKINDDMDIEEDEEEKSPKQLNEEAASQIADAEEEGKERWQVMADTVSSFASLTKEVRALYYRIFTEEKGILGEKKLENVMAIHNSMLTVRESSAASNSEEFLEALKKEASSWSDNASVTEGGELKISGKGYWAQSIYDAIYNDPYMRSLVFSVYKKNHLNYVDHQYKRKGKRNEGSENSMKVIIHTSGLNPTVLTNMYVANIANISRPDLCVFGSDGCLNGITFDELMTKFNTWYDTLNSIPSSKEDYKRERAEALYFISYSLNLDLTDSDIIGLCDNEMAYLQFIVDLNTLKNDLNIEYSKKPGKFNVITFIKDRDKNGYKSFSNLFKHSKKEVNATLSESPVEKSFRYKKSNYVAYTSPCSLGDTLEKIARAVHESIDKKDISILKKFIEDTYLNSAVYADKMVDSKGNVTYNIHNYWVEMLYKEATRFKDNDEAIRNLQNKETYINKFTHEITRQLGNQTIEWENFFEKDNMKFTFVEFFRELSNSAFKTCKVPLFVTGDSNSSRSLTVPFLGIAEIQQRMENLLDQEFARMALFKSLIDGIKEYGNYSYNLDYNLNRFTYFTDLNDLLSADEIKRMQALRVSTDEEDKQAYKDFCKETVSKYIDRHLALFEKNIVDKKLGMYSSIDINTGAGKNAIFSKDELDFFDIEDLKTGTGTTEAKISPQLTKVVYLNLKFHMMTQLQFLTVDPGFYMNVEELQKRYKENIASGDGLDVTALDPSDPTGNTKIDDTRKAWTEVDEETGRVDHVQRVIYFNEIKVPADEEFIQALREAGYSKDAIDNIVAKYMSNPLTDGQGYRSFTSYRRICLQRGIWSKEKEEAFQIIMVARKYHRALTKREGQKIEKLGVTFQPLKPFYYGFEKIPFLKGLLPIPVQHKYAEVPLIPELLPQGSRLAALGRAMEEEEIDLACASTVVKVGGWGMTDIKDCQSSEDFKEAFKKGYKHVLSLSGLRVQTNLPNHSDVIRARGTQFTKHGYGGIGDAKEPKAYSFIEKTFPQGRMKLDDNEGHDITFPNGKISSANMIRMYGALGSIGFIRSFFKLKKKLTDPKELSKTLTHLRMSDPRGTFDSMASYGLKENGEMVAPVSEGMSAFDNMASLMSLFRKKVIKQGIKGGSAVQVSAFGFEDLLKLHYKKENGKTNITYADCVMSFDFSIIGADGKDRKLSYYDYVDPDTGYLLGRDGVTPISPSEINEDASNTRLGREYPGILDLIAYRIPTEKDYSILNLRAAIFVPRAAGGIIMTPKIYTNTAGFDFDADKLYYIRKSYKFKKGEKVGIKYDYSKEGASKAKDKYANTLIDAWEIVYSSVNGGKERLKYEKELAMDEYKEQLKPLFESEKWKKGARKNATKIIEEYRKEHNIAPVKQELYKYWEEANLPGTAQEAFDKMLESNPDIKEELEEAKKEYDKYVINVYSDKLSSYDESKTLFENSQEDVNNLLFDFYRARLMDYDTFRERYTPGGFQQLLDAKPLMMAIRYGEDRLKEVHNMADLLELAKEFKDYSPKYDPSDLSTLVHYQSYNALYDKLIGSAANQNINQRLTALLAQFKLVNPIRFGSILDADKKTVQPGEEDIYSGAGIDLKKRFKNGIDSELLTTEYLTAAVDAVKAALLEFFGMDTSNFSIACLMAKIGATPTDIGLLLNQPVVKEALDLLHNSDYNMSFTVAIDNVLESWGATLAAPAKETIASAKKLFNSEKAEGEGEDGHTKRGTYVTSNALAWNLNPNNYGSIEFLRGQVAVSNLLNELQSAASELSKEVGISKSTSIKSVASSMGQEEAILQNAKVFNKTFGKGSSMFRFKLTNVDPDSKGREVLIDDEESLNEENASNFIVKHSYSPFCMEQTAFSVAKGFMQDVLSNLFPYLRKAYLKTGDLLADLTKDGYLTGEMFDALNSQLGVYAIRHMISAFKDDDQVTLTSVDSEGNEVEYDFPINKQDFYKKMFPKLFVQVKSSLKKQGVELPSFMEAIEATEGMFSALLLPGIGSLSKDQKNFLIESWESMLSSDNPIIRDMAFHLFVYSYYSNGFGFGKNTFLSLASTHLKETICGEGNDSYLEFFNRLFRLHIKDGEFIEGNYDSAFNVKSFLKSFLLNNAQNWYQFHTWANKELESKILENEGNGVITSFTVDMDNIEDDSPYKSLATAHYDDKMNLVGYSFIPCVIYKNNMFICDTDISDTKNVKFNYTEGKQITYYRMNPIQGLIDYSEPKVFEATVVSEKALEDANNTLNNMAKLYESVKNSNNIDESTPGVTEVQDQTSKEETPVNDEEVQQGNINNLISQAVQNAIITGAIKGSQDLTGFVTGIQQNVSDSKYKEALESMASLESAIAVGVSEYSKSSIKQLLDDAKQELSDIQDLCK